MLHYIIVQVQINKFYNRLQKILIFLKTMRVMSLFAIIIFDFAPIYFKILPYCKSIVSFIFERRFISLLSFKRWMNSNFIKFLKKMMGVGAKRSIA